MDLLPKETPALARRQGFRSLKLVSVPMDEPLSESPVGVEYGVLDNGLSRAALAVKVGCVIKIVEPRSQGTLEDLKAVVSKVNSLEGKESVHPWEDEFVPEEIVILKPNPGYAFPQRI